MFINLSLDFITTQVIDLSDLHAGRNGLPQNNIQQSQLAVYGCRKNQMFLATADHLHVHPHVTQTFLHLLHLNIPVQTVLNGPVLHQFQPAFRQIIVLFCPQIFFPGNQFFLIKLLLGFIGPAVPLDICFQLQHFLMYTQFFLLHGNQRIPQQVFLLGQICFRVQNLHIQIFVLQLQNLIASFNLRSFFQKNLMYDSRLQRTDLNGRHRLYLPAHPDIIVELTRNHFTDRKRISIDPKGTQVAPQQEISYEDNHQSPQPVRKFLFTE